MVEETEDQEDIKSSLMIGYKYIGSVFVNIFPPYYFHRKKKEVTGKF